MIENLPLCKMSIFRWKINLMLWTVLGIGSTVCKMIIEFWQAKLRLWRGELSQHFSGCHLFLKG